MLTSLRLFTRAPSTRIRPCLSATCSSGDSVSALLFTAVTLARGSRRSRSAPRAREVRVAGADDHRLAPYVVPHRHGPGRDSRQRAVAAVLGEPARATHGRMT